MRRKTSREKELIKLIEEALTCRSFCKNNPTWTENALRLVGGECSPQIINEKCGIFEAEFSFKGWQVELWKHPSKGYSYRRTTADRLMALESTYKSSSCFFCTAKAAIEAVKDEIESGEV